MMFKALMLENAPAFSASAQLVNEARLPAGDVTVAVAYSTLNYREGLAITNKLPVVRQSPMVAGADSVMASRALRQRAWDRLATDLDPIKLEGMLDEVTLDGAIAKAQALMDGKVRGRVVVPII